MLETEEREAVPNELVGKIIRVNERGDLFSDIPNAAVESLIGKEDVRVELGEHFTLGIFRADHSQPESTLLAIIGADGFVELGIVGMNAHEMLGLRIGETVRIVW